MLALEGALDVATAPQAEEALQQFIKEHGSFVIVDLSRLDFIDSKGVGTLLSAAKSTRDADGRLFVHNPALPVRKILEMCGVAALFPAPPPPAAPEPPAPPAGVAATAARPVRRTA